MTAYLPGDQIELPSSSNENVILGYGIDVQEDRLVAMQPGALRAKENKVWIGVHSRRYIPTDGDRVIGVVVGKAGDFFRIDVGAAEYAVVNFTQFEGATKRNRPNLKTGDVIYATVIESCPPTESELTCIDDENRARGMGQLCDGFLFKILQVIGKFFKFEIAVGMNGKIWINAQGQNEMIAIYNIIKESEFITGDAIVDLTANFHNMYRHSAPSA